MEFDATLIPGMSSDESSTEAVVELCIEGVDPIPVEEGGLFIVGRGDDAVIMLDDPQVSRHHCLLTRRGNGLEIRDLGSGNGTLVNGAKISNQPLADGDLIGVGPFEISVRIQGGEPPPEPMAPFSVLLAAENELAELRSWLDREALPEMGAPAKGGSRKQAGSPKRDSSRGKIVRLERPSSLEADEALEEFEENLPPPIPSHSAKGGKPAPGKGLTLEELQARNQKKHGRSSRSVDSTEEIPLPDLKGIGKKRRPTSASGSRPATASRPRKSPEPGPVAEGPPGKPGSRPGARPTGKPGSRPGARPTGKPGSRPGSRPTGKPGSRPTGKPGSRPTGQHGAPSTGRVRRRVVIVREDERRYAISDGKTATIGRHPECELHIDYKAVSRRHARIEWTPDGLMVNDLGSLNGILVNGEMTRSSALKPGDSFRVGPETFRVEKG